jgi:hypothetical protein
VLGLFLAEFTASLERAAGVLEQNSRQPVDNTPTPAVTGSQVRGRQRYRYLRANLRLEIKFHAIVGVVQNCCIFLRAEAANSRYNRSSALDETLTRGFSCESPVLI